MYKFLDNRHYVILYIKQSCMYIFLDIIHYVILDIKQSCMYIFLDNIHYVISDIKQSCVHIPRQYTLCYFRYKTKLYVHISRQ